MVELNVDYLKEKDKYRSLADKVLYTGMIDEYFDYCLGGNIRLIGIQMKKLIIQ